MILLSQILQIDLYCGDGSIDASVLAGSSAESM